MRKDEISRLLERFLSMQDEGKEAYFDADEIEDLLDSFEESEDYTLYEDVLSLGMKLHPNHPALQIRQCKLMVYNEQYKKALKLIDSISDQDEPELILLRLECLCALDRYAEAKAHTEQLIDSECEYLEDVFECIAPALGELGKYTEALDFIRLGQKYFPDNLVLKEELCYNLEATGQLTEAIELCNELIDNNPYSFDDWTALGRLYSLQGEYEKAIEAFDFALTCDDTECEVKILKAFCLFMNENYQKAIDVYNELVSIPDYTFRVKPLLAECYLRLDAYEPAYELLHDCVYNNKECEEPATYINYLLCCTKTGRLTEEQPILEKALELFPDHVNLLYLKAMYYTEQGKEADAIDTLLYIIDNIQPSEIYLNSLADTNFYLANLFVNRDEYERALKYYLKVQKLVPDYPAVHLKTALCYLKLSDTQNFINEIVQCSDKEINDFEEERMPKDKREDNTPLIELIKDYINLRKNGK